MSLLIAFLFEEIKEISPHKATEGVCLGGHSVPSADELHGINSFLLSDCRMNENKHVTVTSLNLGFLLSSLGTVLDTPHHLVLIN